jgi:anti-sigma regulatory factor (Ser/Thr protein kinase)
VYVEPDVPVDEMAERGRGLVVVSLVMDEVDLRPGEGGSVLRFVKRREPAAR